MNAEPASAPAGNLPLIEITPIGVPGNSAPLELPQSSVAPHEAPSRSASQLPNADDWATATAVLHELLNVNSGLASSIAVREALQRRGVAEARDVVVRLRYYDFESPPDDQHPRPAFRWYGHAKSFYSEERYHKMLKEQARVADHAERTIPTAITTVEPTIAEEKERPRNRQEESRLGTYVVSALEDIYQTDVTPANAPFVFDVHNERAGGDFENVDLLAVHWRSGSVVEIVSVEVKLDFTSRLVQQARNYARFSDRVWIAVPVLADIADAATALREFDPILFEHVIETGLGVLACRRRPGRSYEVIPVQWPRKLTPDLVEKELFVERYRHHFEDACVVPRRDSRQYPNLR
jgi:hypothetical protein